MPDYAMIEILVQTSGEAQLAKLQKQLQSVQDTTLRGAMAQRVASKQMELETAKLRKSNAILAERARLKDSELRDLAIEQREKRVNTELFEKRMDIESRAVNIQFESKRIISDKEARLMAKAQIQKEAADAAYIEGERLKQQETMRTRKALMAASISMFVLNISMGQLVNSLKPFVEGNEDAEKSLKDVQAALQFSMAPLQAYMSLQMISTSLAEEQKVAFLGVASALGAVFFLYEAITAKSAKMRAAYGALTVVLTAMAIAQWAVATGLATTETLMGNIAAVGVVVAGLAALAAVVGYVTAPKAQTSTDHRKRVRKGGIAILDDDEVVTRESKVGGTGSGGNIIINLPESYTGTLSDARITAETVRRYTQTGQGPVKFRRRVTSNGT